jgi:hypothetical protein
MNIETALKVISNAARLVASNLNADAELLKILGWMQW